MMPHADHQVAIELLASRIRAIGGAIESKREELASFRDGVAVCEATILDLEKSLASLKATRERLAYETCYSQEAV